MRSERTWGIWALTSEDLPAGWTYKKVKQLCKITRGSSPRPISKWVTIGEGLPWVKISDLPNNSRYLIETKEKILAEAERLSKTAEPGDLLLSNSATPGIPIFIGVKSCFHDGWMKISDFRGLHKMFFYYLLKNSRHHLLRQVAGGVFDNLKIDILKNFIIPLPPLEKQEKIANILDSLDRAIEENVRTKNTLEKVIQTIFKSWFIDFEPVKAKSEGKSPYGLDEVYAGLFSNAFTDSQLDKIPIGWSINKVWDIANFVNGAAYKNIHFCKPIDGLPVVKIAELKNGFTKQTKYTDSNLGAKYSISTGDILFSWSGSPDTSIDIFLWDKGDSWLNQHIFKVESESPELRTFNYALLVYLKPVFIWMAKNRMTTGLGHVTKGDLQKLLFVCPPIVIIQLFHQKLSPFVNQIEKINQLNAKYVGIRNALLPRLMSGELKVN
jgi:type I restriction enzyme, S subunit